MPENGIACDLSLVVFKHELILFTLAEKKVRKRFVDYVAGRLYWLFIGRLQNSPYFCVFKYATREQSDKRFGNPESETWGETLKMFPSPHTPCERVRFARLARVRLLQHPLQISLLILRKKPTVLQSNS